MKILVLGSRGMVGSAICRRLYKEDVEAIECTSNYAISLVDVIVKVDPNFYRPAEVETLLGNPSLAAKDLGCSPKITLDEMVL